MEADEILNANNLTSMSHTGPQRTKKKRVRHWTAEDRAMHREFEKSRREAFSERLMLADRIMSNASVDDFKPNSVFVEDAEQAQHLGSYSQNINARILNPLAGVTKDDLYDRVYRFYQEYGFQDQVELFQKGALAAQHQKGFENLTELSDEERYHLKREYTHKWHLPKDLYFSIALCSLESAIQGWDNTGANGANLSFPQEFGIENDTWLKGVINSGPTLFGLLSAWAADPLNNWLGRRGTIFLTGLFCVFPVLSQAFTQNWWGLLLCCLFMGLGMGVKISTIPVFSAEISPVPIRGGMVTSFSYGWHLLAAAFAPAVPVLIFVWFCPESPRSLMKKGRYQEAFHSFCRIRNTEMIAARDLYYAHCQVMTDRDAFSGVSFAHRLWEIFTIPRLRRAMISSAILVISQQFSGINIMSFYSSTIFSDAGYSTRDRLLASLGYGLTMFIFGFPTIWTMDTFGRRNLLLFTFPNMAWCLLAAGLCFLISSDSGARVPLIAFFIYLFTALYGPAFGFYAGLNLISFITIFFVVPETMQRTLEDLDYTFGVPVHRHAKYQIGTWLPWFIRRYVFFQRKLHEMALEYSTVSLQVKGVKLNLSTIHYFNFNPPILFLHGFGSCKEDLADLPLHKSLQNYSLLAYDAPGCGQSTSSDLSITDIPFLVATSEAILSHFKINKFHLIGHSMGGLTALLLAKRHPDRILSFIDIKGNLAPEDCFLSRQIFEFPSDDQNLFLNEFIDRTRNKKSFGNPLYASTLRARMKRI
ncbi:hypothetical protein N7493_009729 [Penicillium malachiteum]|uniref:AB hydrolase-1 domain-containing protein n=1 Tax=Penicillium malachiteum TaxID=1324776 RepID=A0AAD6MSI8_9EURO|nr:hypothetical protein N7493_009729 [Penicillium malachiteum]